MNTIVLLVIGWVIFDVGCLVGGLVTLKWLGYSPRALLRSRWASLKARLGFKPPSAQRVYNGGCNADND